MVLPRITEAQAKELAAGAFAAELLRNAARYTVPIGWVKSGGGDTQCLTNGTAFFLRTPKRLMGVTARHVVQAFLAAKSEKSTTTCHLMGEPFPLAQSIISQGTVADIATFRVSDRLVGKLDKQPCTAWPPMMPQEGRGIICAGYPGVERLRTGMQEHNFGLYCVGALAQSVHDTKIVSAPLDRSEVIDTLGKGLPSDEYDLGGMSGAPVFALVETGLVTWQLAGVVSQGLHIGHIFYASRADFIDDDGSVR